MLCLLNWRRWNHAQDGTGEICGQEGVSANFPDWMRPAFIKRRNIGFLESIDPNPMNFFWKTTESSCLFEGKGR